VLLEEGPAVLAHEMMHDRYRDQVVELLQLAEDERAVRPGTGQRDVEMVAPGLGLEAAFAARPRCAVARHPVAELRCGSLEAPAMRFGVVPFVVPDAVDEQTHDRSSCWYPDVGHRRRMPKNLPLNSPLHEMHGRRID